MQNRIEVLENIEGARTGSQMWVSQMVVVRKKDSDVVQICVDPKYLDKAIQRKHHPMKTVEKVIARMPT